MPYLILSDIKSLDNLIKDYDKGRCTNNMFFPEDAPTDQLEVKLAALKLLSKSRPDYSAAALVSTRKRKRDGPGMVERPDAEEHVAAV